MAYSTTAPHLGSTTAAAASGSPHASLTSASTTTQDTLADPIESHHPSAAEPVPLDAENRPLSGDGLGGSAPSKAPTDLTAADDMEKAEVQAVFSDYPDGGWRAWLVVAGGFCCSFTVWGATNAYGVFVSYYNQNQLRDRSESDISWIGSVQLCLVMACAIISGKLFDAGYLKYLLCGGTLLYTAGLFGLSYAESYTHIFLAQGVACGMAAGIIFLPAVSSVSHWFKARRATALGVLACGSSIGGVAYPLMLNNLFPRIGFEWTVRAFGFLTVGLLCIACLTVTTRLPPRKNGPVVDFTVFKQLEYSLFVAGESLIMLGLYTPYYFIQDYALLNGVSSNVALYSLSILNAASLFGRLIPNYLADTFGPLAVLVPQCLISGVLIFAWIGMCKSTVGTIFFCLLFGFSSGAYVSMMPVVIASLTPHDEMNKIGIRIAMAFATISLCALTGTPIAGALVAASGGYVAPACFGGACTLLGSAIVAGSWRIQARKKGTWRV